MTRKFEFCAAHRLLEHKGKCRFIHGHNYTAIVTLTGPTNELGVVCDFGDMKDTIGRWIDEKWDHNIILHEDDPLLKNQTIVGGLSPVEDVFADREPFVMNCNPTAENMAAELARVVNLHTAPSLKLLGVTIRETERCSATMEVDWSKS